MKANIVVKTLAVVVVAVLFVIIMKGGRSNDSQAQSDPGSIETSGLSAIESGPGQIDNGLGIDPLEADYLQEEFGVDVDTPVETMRTLTNETRAVREDSIKLQEENERLKARIDSLLKMEESLNKRIANRFENAERDAAVQKRQLENTQDRTRGLIAQLESRLEELQGSNEKARPRPTDMTLTQPESLRALVMTTAARPSTLIK